jgi:hypothetical protein
MTPGRLRDELAVRSLAWWLPIGALMGAYMSLVSVRDEMVLRSAPVGQGLAAILVTIFLWLALCIFLLNAGFSTRCATRLETTLPLGTRRLWRRHMLAIVLSGAGIPAAAAAVYALGNGIAGRQTLLDPGLVSLTIHAAVGMALALAILQSPRPSLYELEPRRGYIALLVATVLGFVGLVFLLGTLPRVYVLLPLGAAILLFLRIHARLPRTFRLAAHDPEQAPSSARRGAAGATARGGEQVAALHAPVLAERSRRGFRRLLLSTIWRSPFGAWSWLYFPLFIFHGVVLGVSATEGAAEEALLPFIFFTFILLCCWLLVSVSKLYTLDPLPLGRDFIFAALVLPALVAVALSYGVGVAAVRVIRGPVPEIDIQIGTAAAGIRVPEGFWEIAWDGRVPRTEAPWGEGAGTCCIKPLRAGGRIAVYQPYHTPPGSSPEFIAWQASRAIRTVYGREVHYEEIRSRYLADGEDGVEDTTASSALFEDLPDLGSSARGWTFPFVMAFVGFPWLVFAALVHRLNRARGAERFASFVLGGVFALVMALGIGLQLAGVAGLLDLGAMGTFGAILLRRVAESLPGGSFAVYSACAILLAGSYLLAQSQFRRVEAGANPRRG